MDPAPFLSQIDASRPYREPLQADICVQRHLGHRASPLVSQLIGRAFSVRGVGYFRHKASKAVSLLGPTPSVHSADIRLHSSRGGRSCSEEPMMTCFDKTTSPSWPKRPRDEAHSRSPPPLPASPRQSAPTPETTAPFPSARVVELALYDVRCFGLAHPCLAAAPGTLAAERAQRDSRDALNRHDAP